MEEMSCCFIESWEILFLVKRRKETNSLKQENSPRAPRKTGNRSVGCFPLMLSQSPLQNGVWIVGWIGFGLVIVSVEGDRGMDLLQSMNQAMKYIEENLADEIDFREVA